MNDEELISAYVDGRMSEPERAAFEARLQADAALRRQVAVTRLLVDQSRQVEAVKPPKNFILPLDFGKTAKPATPAPRFNLRLLFFRLGSVAAAVVFMFAVAFEALRTTLPAAPLPAAAPMAAQAPEAGMTTNVEPVLPMATVAPAADAAGAAMPEATPMLSSRALPAGEVNPSTELTASTMMTAAMESVPSAKSVPAPEAAPQAMEAQAMEAPAAAPQPESVLTPLRLIAGIALVLAVVLGFVGWIRR
jgi:hypothetical protein